MALCRISGRKSISCITNKLRNNTSVIKQLERQFLNSHQSLQSKRTLYQLSRNLRKISTSLSSNGFPHEANLARLLSVQVRSFSTTNPRQDRNDPEKQNNDEEDEDDKKDKNKDRFRHYVNGITAFWITTLIVLYLSSNNMNDYEQTISWKEFYYDLLLKGEVKQLKVFNSRIAQVYVHPGATVKGKLPTPGYTGNFYRLNVPDDDVTKIEEKVREAERELGILPKDGLEINYTRIGELPRKIMFSLLMFTLYMMLMRTMFRAATNKGPFNMMEKLTKAKFTRVDVKSQHGKGTTFKDVAGLQEAKVEVMEFVDYLKNPKRYEELGARIPKGSLLLGPPGCGKTLLAKAVATEAQVPFLAMAGSEFIEMIGGLGASRVRSLFKEARKSAPCIVYIDEIDALGRKRGGGPTSGEEEQTLNQLLVEMDGMGTTKGVIMLASTNRADVLDKALLRPGRFDRHITIDYPTLAERKEIFEMYMKKLKLKGDGNELITKLSQLTPGMSGADIANVCNEAALHAAREKKKVIEAIDFDYAVERVIAGVAKKSTTLGPAEKKIIAYHESGHALVGWMLKHTDALLKISIIPRTSNALGFAQYAPSDRKLYTTEQLFEKMCMALGGRVAESLVFNHVTTGAQDDLKRVTKMAYNQIRSYGMNEKIGHISFPDDSEQSDFGIKPYSKRLAATIDEEAQSLVARAYKQTEQILKENKEKLHTLATTLLQREVMSYQEVEKVIGPPPHGAKNTIDIAELDSLSETTK